MNFKDIDNVFRKGTKTFKERLTEKALRTWAKKQSTSRTSWHDIDRALRSGVAITSIKN